MSNAIITTAHREWASRPPDQRFRTLDELEAAVAGRRSTARTSTARLGDLSLFPTPEGDLRLAGAESQGVRLSNWSYHQLASRLEVPADFVGSLPAPIAADVLNDRIRKCRKPEDEVQLLIGEPDRRPTLRALTTTDYSRVWDLGVVQLVRSLTDRTSFKNPLAYKDGQFGAEVEPGGLFASDRDVFLTLWDEEHPVEIEGEVLHRFALVWNSETGARSFGMTLGLVRTICRNLILWSARTVLNLRFHHIGRIDGRIAERIPAIVEALGVVDPMAERRAIGQAIRKQIATDDKKAVTWLRDQGFPMKTARAAVASAVREEGGAGTLWQLVQGLTAHARGIPFRDQRAALERQAGKLLELVN